MTLSNKEQELLLTYQNWLKENNLNGKCNVNFIRLGAKPLILTI